jgi:hypothetical protein
MVYFENLSLICFFSSLWKLSIYKNLSVFYFIDASFFAYKLLIPTLRFFGKKIYRLDFKLVEIVDDNNELVRIRIHRKDLIDFSESILQGKAYKSLFHESWRQNNITEYVNKSIILGSIHQEHAISKMLFIINLTNWHSLKLGINESILIAKRRPWIALYQEYANKFNVEIIENKTSFSGFNHIKTLIRSNLFFYNTVKNFKYAGIKNPKLNKSGNKLFLDGRGDFSLINNGYHSDFFWQKNSDFKLDDIVYQSHSIKEKEYLASNGLQTISNRVYSSSNNIRNYKKPILNYSKKFKDESKAIGAILDSYDLERFNSASLFKKFGVKIFFSWDKYGSNHIASSDAIHDNEGISINWQLAFAGSTSAESLINSDIVFSHSAFSNRIESKLNSKIKFNVITGYPKDYAPALLKGRASEIRSNLQVHGAKKIVFVIDENSLNDSRWHTGHELQRDNYSYILKKIFEEPWLGVIFKPKRAIDLRFRLGPVVKLLDKAIATGRCYIFEDSGRYTTTAPPILAGLASDVCIHGHLSAGTAALECALEGIPTLLIDREGTPYSKLSELPKEKVIFQDWPSAIDSMLLHFNSPEGLPGFGDWSSIIDELDPFRDGMAANRMGTYLSWLMEGYEEGLEKDLILKNAAEKYRDKWGHDKVIMKLDNS